VLLLHLNVFAEAKELYAFSTNTQRKQFNHITQHLRCMVCQNQTLADSEAPLAQDLRQDIYKQVKDGKNNDEIVNYVTSRYGDFVLYSPPFKQSTYLLWFFPLLTVIIAMLTLVFVKLRAQKLAKNKDE
jgi:cytochrome c-type biogenesis protein CcmH